MSAPGTHMPTLSCDRASTAGTNRATYGAHYGADSGGSSTARLPVSPPRQPAPALNYHHHCSTVRAPVPGLEVKGGRWDSKTSGRTGGFSVDIPTSPQTCDEVKAGPWSKPPALSPAVPTPKPATIRFASTGGPGTSRPLLTQLGKQVSDRPDKEREQRVQEGETFDLMSHLTSAWWGIPGHEGSTAPMQPSFIPAWAGGRHVFGLQTHASATHCYGADVTDLLRRKMKAGIWKGKADAAFLGDPCSGLMGTPKVLLVKFQY